jgi:hypothetical protein
MVGYARIHRKMVVATFSLITDHSLITVGKLGKMWTAKILHITFMIMMMMTMITLQFIAFFEHTFPVQEELYGTMHIIIWHNAYHSSNKYLKITWIIPGHLWIREMDFTWNAVTDNIFLLFPLTSLVTIVICNAKYSSCNYSSLNFFRVGRFLEIVHHSIRKTATWSIQNSNLVYTKQQLGLYKTIPWSIQNTNLVYTKHKTWIFFSKIQIWK